MIGTENQGTAKRNASLLLLVLVLGGALATLCHDGFKAHYVFWANDSPLGAIKTESARLPNTFHGYWQDNNWIGIEGPASSPSLTTLIATPISPETFLKIYTPLSMFILGFCAWWFFREMGFGPPVCVLGGVAAGLNMHFFSVACWGLGVWNVSMGMVFLSLTALVTKAIRQLWAKGMLAGLAVGMSVMEGFDVGAILSIYVGIFILFLFWITEEKPANRIIKGFGVGAIVVLSSVFISANTLSTLVGTQIKGATQSNQSAEDKWIFTTQWSTPKLDTLRVFMGGVLGYRMQEFITDEDKSSAYWGKQAEDPHVEDLESSDPNLRASTAASLGAPADVQAALKGDDVSARTQIINAYKDRLQRRHSGSGEYAGVLVCLLAVFGAASAFRKEDSPYSVVERRMVWFWSIAAVFSLLAAWGRHGFLYRLLYQIPVFSAIRNPMKFMHPLNVLLLILAGFGMEVLYRWHVQKDGAPSKFGKRWSAGMIVVVVLAFVGNLILYSHKADLAGYLQNEGFSPDLAPQMASFCCKEVVWFVFFLALSVIVLVLVLRGVLSGSRMKWAWVALGAILICDLGRSDLPWIRYYDYTEKYSMNPVIDYLRNHQHEGRVVGRLSPMGPYDIVMDSNFGALCHWWLENDMPYNNIQSLEIDQWPRMPVLDNSYLSMFTPHTQNDLARVGRLWKLTNTRYLLAGAGIVPQLNQLADPLRHGFHTLIQFDMVAKPAAVYTNALGTVSMRIEDAGDLYASPSDKGPCALVEYDNVLPRAKLYSDWQTPGEDNTILDTLASPNFDPDRVVLISKSTPPGQAPSAPGADPGVVAITEYHPTDITLKATVKTTAVLLLNEKIGAGWKVTVDHAPANVLTCNYLMRGVFLTPGTHEVEFIFRPTIMTLYVSFAALVVGLALGGYLIATRNRHCSETVGKSLPPSSE